jgi:hypothetical protein
MHRAQIGLERDPEKWTPVFRKRSCSNTKLYRGISLPPVTPPSIVKIAPVV